MADKPQPFRPFGLKPKRHSGPRPEWRRLYGRRWADYARAFLAREPMCVMCRAKEQVRPAEVVDHITPHKGNESLFWDTDNHQALCKRCHDRKTVVQDGGFGRNISPDR